MVEGPIFKDSNDTVGVDFYLIDLNQAVSSRCHVGLALERPASMEPF